MRQSIFAAIIAILFFQSASRSDAAERASSVSDSPELMEFFNVISEIAADGPSLSYFGWSEEKQAMAEDAKCYPAGLHDATEYLVRLVDQLEWATKEQREKIDRVMSKALDDFREILSEDTMNQCEWDVSEQMSLTRVTQFTTLTSGYKITFSLGYED
jgi:hypothetical protein